MVSFLARNGTNDQVLFSQGAYILDYMTLHLHYSRERLVSKYGFGSVNNNSQVGKKRKMWRRKMMIR